MFAEKTLWFKETKGNNHGKTGTGRIVPRILGVFFRNYLVFGGRSSRSEFWYIALWGVLISLVTSIGTAAFEDFGAVVSVLSIILGLATLLPGIALVLRRLRDAGYSPWLILLSFVPFVGSIVVLILCAMASKPVATES